MGPGRLSVFGGGGSWPMVALRRIGTHLPPVGMAKVAFVYLPWDGSFPACRGVVTYSGGSGDLRPRSILRRMAGPIIHTPSAVALLKRPCRPDKKRFGGIRSRAEVWPPCTVYNHGAVYSPAWIALINSSGYFVEFNCNFPMAEHLFLCYTECTCEKQPTFQVLSSHPRNPSNPPPERWIRRHSFRIRHTGANPGIP